MGQSTYTAISRLLVVLLLQLLLFFLLFFFLFFQSVCAIRVILADSWPRSMLPMNPRDCAAVQTHERC